MERTKELSWLYRAILFFVLLCLVLALISPPFVYPYSDDAYGWIKAIYEERPGSLDAVFIGTSNTVAFWVPLFAWKNFGIASCNLANNGGKLEGFRYLIEEARKTQPDALYVISIGNPSMSIQHKWIHWATDYMRPSLTKLRMIRAYAKYNSFSTAQIAEILFPLFCYHSRWEELTSKDFSRFVFAKGASIYEAFLCYSENIEDSVRTVDKRAELQDGTEEALIDLLNYLNDNQIQALFLNPPQFSFTDEEFAQANTIMDMIESYGYPVLRARDRMDEIGLDSTKEFYNENHTNIHGAAKYTQFVANQLMKTYEIRDKRGDPDYDDFEVAYADYLSVISSYVLDFEINGSVRGNHLISPEINPVEAEDGRVHISWSASPEADGYFVYRQMALSENKETAWERIAALDGEQLEFSDPVPMTGSKYFYAVVPYSSAKIDGQPILAYGDYNVVSVSVSK